MGRMARGAGALAKGFALCACGAFTQSILVQKKGLGWCDGGLGGGLLGGEFADADPAERDHDGRGGQAQRQPSDLEGEA